MNQTLGDRKGESLQTGLESIGSLTASSDCQVSCTCSAPKLQCTPAPC